MNLLILLFAVASALGPHDVVFVIISQNNKYNQKLATNLESSIQSQSKLLYEETPIVYISNRDFPHISGWTILPLLSNLVALHEDNTLWLFIIQDFTIVKLKNLLNLLEKYDHNEEIWLGNALHDELATIIHHFAFYENPTFFKYPNLASGIAISFPLVKKLSVEWEEDKILTLNFHIDAGHELARFVWNEAKGPMLKHENALCSTFEKPSLMLKPKDLCATYPNSFQTCDNLVPRNNIYFAVKTCTKFHNDRVPIVKNTWGNHTPIINFFSDTKDISIPTIDLGIPNTEHGHCMKTLAVIKYIAEEIQNNKNIKWIVIADDDTILGVTNLQRLLSCYDHKEKIGLGERYGYELRDPRGYNYITGGGGMVFSKSLLQDLANSCVCPSLAAPDDMYLGICMHRLGIEVTHAPGFHQARPSDYSPNYLESHEAVSFHKHFMNDPIKIYKEWFETNDVALKEETYDIKDEL